PDDTATSSAKKVLLVSGRLYYDLVDRRKKLEQENDVAIIRVEQLYPLPAEEIATELAKYTNAKVYWVQDEPSNQGPWPFILHNLLPKLDQLVEVISRSAAASPSAGNTPRHDEEHETLMQDIFGALSTGKAQWHLLPSRKLRRNRRLTTVLETTPLRWRQRNAS